jgi:hypothetical protein
VLRDISGRTVYHRNAEGPESFVVESGLVRNGTYVARLVSGNTKIEQKVLIVR